jgi:hypothetical protein
MLMIDVNRHEYEPATGRLLLSWSVPAGVDVGLTRDRLEIRFTPALESVTDVEVFDAFCGCLLPHLAQRTSRLVVNGLPQVNRARHEFWRWYLHELGIGVAVDFGPDATAASETGAGREAADLSGPTLHRTGLYFGGGVESMALLRLIKHTKPYLMTVDGPAWMNSDYDRSSIKGGIQQSLAQRYGLEFLRIWTDARTLFPEGDEYVNKYITGSLFYYTLLPLMRRHAVGTCYLACELEYALYELPFDLSLHSRFVHKVSRAPDPPLLSPLNAIPKIDLLDDLYHGDPELCSYLYSCLLNSQNRWCGECGKCRRISAYCEAIGLPRELIGMQEGICHDPETGAKTRALYWQSLQRYRERTQGSQSDPMPATAKSFWKWPRLRRSA